MSEFGTAHVPDCPCALCSSARPKEYKGPAVPVPGVASANRNMKMTALAPAPVPGASGDKVCARCGQKIMPPSHDPDQEQAPVCWQCRQRPCEGYSAWCHECACSGAVRLSPGMCRCGARWPGDRVCHCSSCHLSFTSVGPFDAHRAAPGDDRRCMTGDELRAKGYEPNTNGHWRKPAPEGSFKWTGEG